MRSNKPNAEKFQEWVCEDVLPSIRKHGSYTIENKYEERFNHINMLIKDSSIEEKLNRTDLDKEAEELENKFEWFKFTNHNVIYLSYIGDGLIKLGFSDCGLTKREKKHMSSTETEFDQFRIISAFKISSGKIETMIKDLLVRYKVKFNKQTEIYKPVGNLGEFIEMIETLLVDNDLRYQLDIAKQEIEIKNALILELQNKIEL